MNGLPSKPNGRWLLPFSFGGRMSAGSETGRSVLVQAADRSTSETRNLTFGICRTIAAQFAAATAAQRLLQKSANWRCRPQASFTVPISLPQCRRSDRASPTTTSATAQPLCSRRSSSCWRGAGSECTSSLGSGGDDGLDGSMVGSPGRLSANEASGRFRRPALPSEVDPIERARPGSTWRLKPMMWSDSVSGAPRCWHSPVGERCDRWADRAGSAPRRDGVEHIYRPARTAPGAD